MGIYDNEPSNDWMTPQREVVASLKEFADSWQMADESSSCPVKSVVSQTNDQPTDWEREQCQEIFQVYTIIRPKMN